MRASLAGRRSGDVGQPAGGPCSSSHTPNGEHFLGRDDEMVTSHIPSDFTPGRRSARKVWRTVHSGRQTAFHLGIDHLTSRGSRKAINRRSGCPSRPFRADFPSARSRCRSTGHAAGIGGSRGPGPFGTRGTRVMARDRRSEGLAGSRCVPPGQLSPIHRGRHVGLSGLEMNIGVIGHLMALGGMFRLALLWTPCWRSESPYDPSI